jgi:hypothetical protein
MGFDTHMILETVPVLPSTRQNAHQAINPTSRHYAEALHGAHAVVVSHQVGVAASWLPCHDPILAYREHGKRRVTPMRCQNV